LQDSVDRITAETASSGVVRVDRGDEIEFAKVEQPSGEYATLPIWDETS